MVQNVLFFGGMENGFMFGFYFLNKISRAGINSENLFESSKEPEHLLNVATSTKCSLQYKKLH